MHSVFILRKTSKQVSKQMNDLRPFAMIASENYHITQRSSSSMFDVKMAPGFGFNLPLLKLVEQEKKV